MKPSELSELRNILSAPVTTVPNYKLLLKQYPRASIDTLISVYSQLGQEHVKQTSDACWRGIPRHSERYFSGVDILDVSHEAQYPPCLLIRRILEHRFQLNKQVSGAVLRSPQLLPNFLQEVDRVLLQRVQVDFVRCVCADVNSSPFCDIAKQSIGLEFEFLLGECLHSLNIPFWSEEELRRRGMHKTPDAYLQVPMLVHGKVVTWIDSKATYGDTQMHERQMEEQYAGYVRRYGPGLVVYWFGYSEEIMADVGDVQVLDSFPEAACIQLLPVLTAAGCS